MHPGSNGRHNGANGRTGIRKQRRHMRAILKEGLEAALRADPDVLETCKPKTAYGRIVCGLVLEAAKCKATPLKTLMSLIDWDADLEGDEGRDPDDDTAWDWSEDGEWLTKPEPETAPPSESAADAAVGATVDVTDGPAKRELKRRLMRLAEAGQHEHVARIMDAIRAASQEPEPLSTA